MNQTEWTEINNQLVKEFTFKDFTQAWGFMTKVAFVAEKMNHHPEWTNKYNVVDVTLTTHSTRGLTRLDTDLARAMDRLAPDAEIQRDHGKPVSCLCELHARKA